MDATARPAVVRLLEAQFEEHAILLSSERLDAAVASLIEAPGRIQRMSRDGSEIDATMAWSLTGLSTTL